MDGRIAGADGANGMVDVPVYKRNEIDRIPFVGFHTNLAVNLRSEWRLFLQPCQQRRNPSELLRLLAPA